jgi:hypothetical protein
MKQNSIKFGRDRKVEVKKSFELYPEILLPKVGLNLIHFA